jgi:acetyl esterase/lipase
MLQIQVGEDQVENGDGIRVAETAKAAGVNVEVKIYPRMWSAWKTLPGLSPAPQSLDKVVQYLLCHLKMKLV